MLNTNYSQRNTMQQALNSSKASQNVAFGQSYPLTKGLTEAAETIGARIDGLTLRATDQLNRGGKLFGSMVYDFDRFDNAKLDIYVRNVDGKTELQPWVNLKSSLGNVEARRLLDENDKWTRELAIDSDGGQGPFLCINQADGTFEVTKDGVDLKNKRLSIKIAKKILAAFQK